MNNAEEYTYSFKAQIKHKRCSPGGCEERFEDIEYVITTETEVTMEKARFVFKALYPNLTINRVVDFRRLPA